ncbi:MAG: hypothetical protein JXA89_04720 [Anaerolineae bacterium]|nr:hypothetical protein [Anaerolineae bacterium]
MTDMDKVQVPTLYADLLTAYLNGGALDPLLALFDDHARVERYIWGETPRLYCGLEQIEESFLRLPAVGGTFHITDVQVEGDIVHAWFVTEQFAYPLQGTYRFELNDQSKIVRLYTSAAYRRAAS